MDGQRQWSEGEAAAELLDWWIEAGVDIAVAESPRDWLRAPEPGPAPQPQAETGANVAEPSHQTLAEMRDWLASSLQLPLASASARRILPHGPENAEVMLISDAPALEDLASGQPIGGDAWALAVKMLAAIGIDSDAAYSAPLTSFYSPGTRPSPADRERCAEIVRKHIALVKPRRLVLFGDTAAKALLGQPLAAARGHAHKVEGVRTIATYHPRWLMQRPGDKALAWRDLLLLMEEEF
jgi:uracil-DNA glycosylase family 4